MYVIYFFIALIVIVLVILFVRRFNKRSETIEEENTKNREKKIR